MNENFLTFYKLLYLLITIGVSYPTSNAYVIYVE